MARPHLPVRRSPQLAWCITVPLVLVATVLSAVVGLNTSNARPAFGELPLAIVFIAAWAVADATLLNVNLRRHSMSASIDEIVLIVALFYLPPLTLLTVRVLVGVLTQVFYRRTFFVKGCFNIANLAAALAVANTVMFAFGPVTDLQKPSSWAVLGAAVLAFDAVTLAAGIGVITLVQGPTSSQQTIRAFGPLLVVDLVNIVIGLLVLLVLRQSPWTLILLGVVAAGLVLLYRAYARFVRQHRTLGELHDLTQALAATEHDGTLADVLLGRVRGLLQAEYATLWLPKLGRFPEVLLSAKVDFPGLLDTTGTPAAVRQRAAETGTSICVGPRTAGRDLQEALRETGVKDVIVVPLRSGTAVIGTLEVAGRLGDLLHFEPDDVRLLEMLAAHVGVTVENSRLVDRLRFDAYHDSLTGLPNRRRLLVALDEAVKVRAPGEVVAVLLFDVAGLRDVNDSLGHAAGDKVLIEVANRLRGLVPAAALVARVGGDEFAATLRTPSADAAMTMAHEVRAALQQPMKLGTFTIDIDTVVGAAVHPEHGTDAATLLQRADVATHAAKQVSSAVQLFNLGLESRSVRRLGLAGDLRRALDAGEMEVYFQPKVALSDRRMVGVECLARWEHPVHGSVAPEDFVAVAEHTGQLGRLTEAVLRAGLSRAREQSDAGRPLDIAVNLSPRTLIDPNFPVCVEELLQEYGVQPQRLTLEITEDGVLGETDRPLPTLRRLHEIGVRLSVDDFGTGYSSLSYLRRLPVQEIKIDRSFVQGMATDPGDLAIVRAVVDLARHFGLIVVAEGVESELTLSLLNEMGCDIGQGFLFSRPLSYERLEAWLQAQSEVEADSTDDQGDRDARRLRAVP